MADKRQTVEITGLGGKGDGLARAADGTKLFIPFALPGELAEVTIHRPRGDGMLAELRAIERESPERAPPFCPHYRKCGGCQMQHLTETAYGEWKRGQLIGALARLEKGGMVGQTIIVPPASRRRAAFAFIKQGNRLRLGFNALASEEIIEIGECPLLLPSLNRLLPLLRHSLGAALPAKAKGDAVINMTAAGLDLWIDCTAVPDLDARQRLALFVEEADLARLSWGKSRELLAQRRRPFMEFGSARVNVPPGAFLQPSAEGEAAIVAHVMKWAADSSSVIDLFAGCGSLGLSLPDHVRLHAVEGEAALVEALLAGARHSGRGTKVSAEKRDLVRSPVAAAELDRFETIIFDPPRPGAAAQAREMAKARKPRRIIAVSCNPATFAHDVFLLAQGGWQLTMVRPLDQFPFTTHLEILAVLERPDK